MTQPQPLQNLKAEEATLGSLLIDPTAMERVKHYLAVDDFYREKNSWLYSAMLALAERKEPIDFITVCDELGPRINQVGADYIASLINAAVSSLHVEAYAREVIRCANNRRLAAAGTKIVQLAYANGDDMENYSQAMTILRDTHFSGKMTTAAGGKKIAQEMLADLARAQAEKEKKAGYEPTWPWAAMREKARWRAGQPAVLIAEGGVGKTAFCCAVAIHNAVNGGRIFYVATEDSPSVLRTRILATISGVPYRQIETAKYGDNYPTISIAPPGVDIPRQIVGAISSIDSWRGELHILPVAGKTISEIIFDLSRLEATVGKPDAVIFDWFLDHKQRPQTTDGLVVGLMADIQDLKTYAAEHETCLLVATQTGKSGGGRWLTGLDAYYTSSWNHYAKLVITLKRERESINGQPIGQFKPEIDVFISKANLDQTGAFKLAMRGETFAIYEVNQQQNGRDSLAT